MVGWNTHYRLLNCKATVVTITYTAFPDLPVPLPLGLATPLWQASGMTELLHWLALVSWSKLEWLKRLTSVVVSSPAAFGFTMSSNENDIQDAPSKRGEQEQQNLVSRVASLPLVSAAYDMVSTTYTSIKETHPVIRSICDVAETGVRTITSATVSGTQPILDQQEPQELLVSASDYACESLDKLEEKLPILQQPDDQVASDAKELVSSTQTDAKDAVCSTVTEAKDAVTSMVGVAKGAVQESVEVTKPAVTGSMSTVMGSSMGQIIMSGVDLVLETSESLVDHYLPMTDEELHKPKET
ncbi:unnamed protein product [Caretta caretta]